MTTRSWSQWRVDRGHSYAVQANRNSSYADAVAAEEMSWVWPASVRRVPLEGVRESPVRAVASARSSRRQARRSASRPRAPKIARVTARGTARRASCGTVGADDLSPEATSSRGRANDRLDRRDRLANSASLPTHQEALVLRRKRPRPDPPIRLAVRRLRPSDTTDFHSGSPHDGARAEVPGLSPGVIHGLLLPVWRGPEPLGRCFTS